MPWSLLSLDQRGEWEAVVDGLPHACGHTWRYNHAIARSSGHPAFLFVYRGTGGTMVLPFAERESAEGIDIYSPYGWSGIAMEDRHGGSGSACDSGFGHAWRSFVRDRRYLCGYLMMHPALPFPAEVSGLEETAYPNDAHVLDLGRPLEHLMASLSTDHRQRLRQWQRQRFEIVEDQNELRDRFLTLYPPFVRQIGAAAVYHFTTETLVELVESPEAFLVGVRSHGEVTAVSLFLRTAWVGEYFLTALQENGGVHTRGMIWRAIERLKEEGVRVLNLGGGIREGDSLATFKQRFGGRPVKMTVLKQIYDTEKFAAACAGVGVQPDRIGYFPPYRAPAASAQRRLESQQ